MVSKNMAMSMSRNKDMNNSKGSEQIRAIKKIKDNFLFPMINENLFFNVDCCCRRSKASAYTFALIPAHIDKDGSGDRIKDICISAASNWI